MHLGRPRLTRFGVGVLTAATLAFISPAVAYAGNPVQPGGACSGTPGPFLSASKTGSYDHVFLGPKVDHNGASTALYVDLTATISTVTVVSNTTVGNIGILTNDLRAEGYDAHSAWEVDGGTYQATAKVPAHNSLYWQYSMPIDTFNVTQYYLNSGCVKYGQTYGTAEIFVDGDGFKTWTTSYSG
jgi:hypothetical protein